MHNKIFKHLVTLFFVLVLLTIFGIHWTVNEKSSGTKNPQEKSTMEIEQEKRNAYLEIFGNPPEAINPELMNTQENKTAEKNK
jgi:hypothetical protein